MKQIALTQGKFALVDDEDFEELNKFKWQYDGGYARRSSPPINGKRYTIQMHRVINKTPDGFITDHADGDTLNNRKYNLRDCNSAENQRNKNINNPNGYKGICMSVSNVKGKQYKYIHARIFYNGKSLHLGQFDTVEEAAIAYNEAAVKYFGKFARLNKI